MYRKTIFSFITGFIILFIVYHFPEFFSAFWIMATFKIGFLVVAFLLARVQGWKSLGGYGLGLTSKWFTNLITGLSIGLLFFALSVFVSIKLGYEEIAGVGSFRNVINQLPMILLMTSFPSVAEDILTRGYLYGHLQFMKPLGWILLSSVVYVLNHIWRLHDGAGVLSYLLLLGMVLASAVWLTKSLWLAFGIHWGANIAFESTNSIIPIKTLVQHDGSTWLLAASWGLLLVILAILHLTNVFNKNI